MMDNKSIPFIPPVFVKYVGYDKHKDRLAEFRCQCGKIFVTQFRAVKKGNTKSCGCYRTKVMKARRTTHGMGKSRLFRIWHGMRNRCRLPSYPGFKNYGGRGITVCNEWKTFEPFMNWALNNEYKEDLTIDRINNDGNYEHSNCRWVDYRSQNTNKRSRKDSKKFTGVRNPIKEGGKYTSYIGKNNKQICLGRFDTPEEAYEAYLKAKEERTLEYSK